MFNQKELIKISRVSKTYECDAEPDCVLLDVSLRVSRGEIVAITGPSGCGKSTLLFILGLFLSPTSGLYNFAGKDVLSLGHSAQAEFRRNQVGFVFQNADLLENSTVYENLEFPLIYAGISRAERPTRICEALERVRLGRRIHHASNLLSGGERQRVAVARALVNRPQVILADEPTGQLDRENTQIVMDHFEAIASGSDTAVIVVTHDPIVADRCDRTYLLEDGLLKES
jgi:putative ABC transport system ATP-binding protein